MFLNYIIVYLKRELNDIEFSLINFKIVTLITFQGSGLKRREIRILSASLTTQTFGVVGFDEQIRAWALRYA